ncbi:MAG: N-acetylmuramoyl-L-alanine amidase [Clostridia bacterium]|nr:N-acetylmuramoyl-L-alanine amidase [Clostridia bacterium]
MKEKQKIFTVTSVIFGLLLLLLVCVSENTQAVNMSIHEKKQDILIIDAGHGGEDGGAIAADGTLEKDINLNIALQVKSMATLFGYKTIMIRTTDSDLADHSLSTIRKRKVSDINARMNILKENPSAIYVGIHQNYYEGANVRGFQVFYSENSDISKNIAYSIQEYTNRVLQPQSARKVQSAGDSIYLLKHAPIPAVMVECGFLSNQEELKLLKTADFGCKIAMTIIGGISKFFTDARIT